MRPMVLLLPLLLLLIAAIGLVFAYVKNRRRQRLLRRIEAAVPPRPLTAPLVPVQQQGLRMRRVRAGEAGLLARIINLPVDLPLANVISPVWVFLVAVVAGAGVVWFGHLLAGWYISSVEGVVAAFLVLRWVFGWELGWYRAKLIRQLPDAVQLVISATRAGLPVTEAFQAIASEMPSPTKDEFVRVSNEVALGVPAEDALLSVHRRTGVTEYAIFAVTIGVQQRSGGRLAETIQNLADMVRERLSIAARARALAGEAKGSAIIMAALPVVAGIMLSFIQPGHLDPLFHDPRGIRMFVFGVTTLFLGIVTMRQMIRGSDAGLTEDRILLALLAIGVAILLVAGAATLMLREMAARDLEQRVLSLAYGRIDGAALGSPSALGSMHRLLSRIGATVRGRTKLYSERDLMVLEGMIAGTGFNPRTVLPLVLGAKVVLTIGIPLVAIVYARFIGLSGGQQFLTLCIAIPLGLLGPDWALTLLRRPYLAALRRGVPDALDLLVVCTEAGMALENALEHVAQEIRHSNPAISVALGKLLDEMRVLPDRRDAVRNFAERSGVEGARRVATMLGQSMQYGTPISQALRTVAVDLRRERMVALEAKAVRLPVLLVLPLILFIMPSLFIVLVGPAMLHLMDSLHAAIVAH